MIHKLLLLFLTYAVSDKIFRWPLDNQQSCLIIKDLSSKYKNKIYHSCLESDNDLHDKKLNKVDTSFNEFIVSSILF